MIAKATQKYEIREVITPSPGRATGLRDGSESPSEPGHDAKTHQVRYSSGVDGNKDAKCDAADKLSWIRWRGSTYRRGGVS